MQSFRHVKGKPLHFLDRRGLYFGVLFRLCRSTAYPGVGVGRCHRRGLWGKRDFLIHFTYSLISNASERTSWAACPFGSVSKTVSPCPALSANPTQIGRASCRERV